MEEKINLMEKRLDVVEQKLPTLDERVLNLEGRMHLALTNQKSLTDSLSKVEKGVESIDTVIRGDGTGSGMAAKVELLVRNSERDEKEDRDNRKKWRWVVISGIVTLIANAIMGFVSLIMASN